MAKHLRSYQRRVLKFLGVVGYGASFCEWLLVTALYLPALFETSIGKRIFPMSAPPQPATVQVEHAGSIPPVFIAVAMGAAVVFLGLVLYLTLYYYPRKATKVVSEAVHKTAEAVAPMVARKTRHKPTIRARKIVSERLTFWLKLVFALLPAGLVAAQYGAGEPFAIELATAACAVCAMVAVVGFFLQRHMAWRWQTKPEDVFEQGLL